MDLPTLITTLDSTDLTREVRSTNSSYGETITYVNNTKDTLNCNINSDTYSHVTILCLIVKNNITYLYVNCNNQRYFNKVAISTISSISITS